MHRYALKGEPQINVLFADFLYKKICIHKFKCSHGSLIQKKFFFSGLITRGRGVKPPEPISKNDFFFIKGKSGRLIWTIKVWGGGRYSDLRGWTTKTPLIFLCLPLMGIFRPYIHIYICVKTRCSETVEPSSPTTFNQLRQYVIKNVVSRVHAENTGLQVVSPIYHKIIIPSYFVFD